jgi:hypothetical protein
MDRRLPSSPKRHPTRVGERALVDERLHLDQQGSSPLARHHDHAARHRFVVPREKDRRGVLDLPQPAVAHREDTELVHGTEAILDGAHQPKGTAGLALEIEHGIDHVLQHTRTGERSVLGHMPDQKDDRVLLLGETDQLGGRLAHLRDRAGGRLQGVGVEGLNGVDDHHARPLLRRGREDRLDIGLGKQPDPVARQSEPMGAQPDLLGRLLAADVEHRAGARERGARLEQERRLADPRITPDQHHRAGHQAAPQHAVQLADPALDAHPILGADVGQALDARRLGGTGVAAAHRRPRDLGGLHHAVPSPAVRALTRPFRLARTAGVADIAAAGLPVAHGQVRSLR